MTIEQTEAIITAHKYCRECGSSRRTLDSDGYCTRCNGPDPEEIVQPVRSRLTMMKGFYDSPDAKRSR